jgi:hypothetical protein
VPSFFSTPREQRSYPPSLPPSPGFSHPKTACSPSSLACLSSTPPPLGARRPGASPTPHLNTHTHARARAPAPNLGLLLTHVRVLLIHMREHRKRLDHPLPPSAPKVLRSIGKKTRGLARHTRTLAPPLDPPATNKNKTRQNTRRLFAISCASCLVTTSLLEYYKNSDRHPRKRTKRKGAAPPPRGGEGDREPKGATRPLPKAGGSFSRVSRTLPRE